MKLLRRLRHWLTAERHADALREELEAHRAFLQQEFEARGLAPSDAASASRRAMGNATLAREDAREVWTVATGHRLWRDARHGIRSLRREPSFAAAAILTLAIGLAATTASFSVADAELWKPLPYPEPDRLVAVYATGPGPQGRREYVSGPAFLEWTGSRAFASLAGIGEARRRVLRGRTSHAVVAAAVTWNYFATLGREPLAGRMFISEDVRAGGIMLGEGAWRELFGADPAAVGMSFMLDADPVRIVGIIATEDAIDSSRGVFVPLDTSSPAFLDPDGRAIQAAVGRLEPGVDRKRAEAELRTIAARASREAPGDRSTPLEMHVEDLQTYYTGYNWRPLYFLLGISLLILLLTCVNVAGLLLVRALRRSREFAIRGALGGGTTALIRQLAVEGALLALPAAVLALLLARWMLVFVVTQVPPEYLVRGSDIPLDVRVVLVAFGVAGITAVICAVIPALLVRRVDVNLMLAGGGRTAGLAPGRSRMRRALLTAQVALTLVLLAGAGLFLKSYIKLTGVPLGFDPHNRVSLRMSLSGPRYASDRRIHDYANQLQERVLAVAGIADAAVATSSPLASGPVVEFTTGSARVDSGAAPRAIIRATTPGFFDVLDIPIVEGRGYTAADGPGAPRVAVVNDVLARRMFPGESAVGRTLTLLPGARAAWTRRPGELTIIGVAGNVKEVGINEVEFNDIYVPLAQLSGPGLEVIARASVDPPAVLRSLRDAVAGADPEIPAGEPSLLTTRVEAALREDRFHLLLIGSLAAVAIVLAGIGVYGAVASAAYQRRREYGVRIALGARPAHVLGTALREPLRIGVAGGVLGLASSLVVAMAIGDALYLVPGQHNGLLFNVTTTDPVVLGSAVSGVLMLAIVAGVAPARRAARVDPLSVLREE